MSWYYEKEGSQLGPVTDEELLKLHQDGGITDSTLVWREGMTNWSPMRESGPRPVPQQSQKGAPIHARPERFGKAHFGRALKESSSLLFSGKGAMIFLAGFVTWLVYAFASAAPVISNLSMIFTPALLAGFQFYCLRHARMEVPAFGDIFAGFSRNFVQLILFGLILLAVQVVAFLLGALVLFAMDPDTVIGFFNSTVEPDEVSWSAIITASLCASLPFAYFSFATSLTPLFLVDLRNGIGAGLRNSFVAIHQNLAAFGLWLLVSVVIYAVFLAPAIYFGIQNFQRLSDGFLAVLLFMLTASLTAGIASLIVILQMVVLYRDVSQIPKVSETISR